MLDQHAGEPLGLSLQYGLMDPDDFEAIGPLHQVRVGLDRSARDVLRAGGQMKSVGIGGFSVRPPRSLPGRISTTRRMPDSIQSFGSGSIDISVQVDLVSGAQVLAFVTAMVQLNTSIVGAGRARAQLEQQEAPAEALQILRNWEGDRISMKLDRLRSGLLEKFRGEDERKNELRNALSSSLKFLADRIDRGLEIAVHSTPPEEEPAGEEAGVSAASLEHEKIQQLASVLDKLERPDTPVLQLDSGSSGDVDGSPE
jgi:hypothetical protein